MSKRNPVWKESRNTLSTLDKHTKRKKCDVPSNSSTEEYTYKKSYNFGFDHNECDCGCGYKKTCCFDEKKCRKKCGCDECNEKSPCSCKECEDSSVCSSVDDNSCGKEKHNCEGFNHHKCHELEKKKDCCCTKPKFLENIQTKCGVLSATLTLSADKNSYIAVGDVITYTYTLKNTGAVVISGPIQIEDTFLGGQLIQNAYIYPGTSQSYVRRYVVTSQDLLNKSITNSATSFYMYSKCVYLVSPSNELVINYGNADVTGSIYQERLQDGEGVYIIRVLVSLINSPVSETDATNVSLVLRLPDAVSTVVPGSGIGSANPPVFNPSTMTAPANVTLSQNVIPVGASFLYQFTYSLPINNNPYTIMWAGYVTSDTYDPNIGNNYLSNIITILPLP